MAIAVPSDKQIRQAIAGIIDTATATFYSGQNIYPRIHDRWKLSLDVGDSAALLRATEGINKSKVHAWMIGSDSMLRERRDAKDGFHTGSMQKVGPNQRTVTKTYRVWYFKQAVMGTDNDNSENDVMNEIEYVATAIDKSPMLGLTSYNSFRGHMALNFPVIDTWPMGEVPIHIAKGTLSVVIYNYIE